MTQSIDTMTQSIDTMTQSIDTMTQSIDTMTQSIDEVFMLCINTFLNCTPGSCVDWLCVIKEQNQGALVYSESIVLPKFNKFIAIRHDTKFILLTL